MKGTNIDYLTPFAVFVLAPSSNGLYAATTRLKDINCKETIGLPGGKLDDGEDPIQAILREAEEEGWLLEDVNPKPIYYENRNGKYIFWYYAKHAIKLKDYKEKYRLENIEVTKEEILTSGQGNDKLASYLNSNI